MGCLQIIWLGWDSCSLLPIWNQSQPTKKCFAVGKSGPNSTLNQIFRGLGWPWVGVFVGFIIIIIHVFQPNRTWLMANTLFTDSVLSTVLFKLLLKVYPICISFAKRRVISAIMRTLKEPSLIRPSAYIHFKKKRSVFRYRDTCFTSAPNPVLCTRYDIPIPVGYLQAQHCIRYNMTLR